MNFWQYYFLPKDAQWWSGGIYGNIFASILWSAPILITVYKTRFKCAKCWRPSYHLVQNTHLKTCHKHTTPSWHAKIEQEFAEKHPEAHAFLSGGTR